MSTKNRPVSQIQVEYQQLCTKLGHLYYQHLTIADEIQLLKSTLRDLNIEAAESSKAESEPKLVEAADVISEAG